MEKPIQRVAIYCRSCKPKSDELSDFQPCFLINRIKNDPQMELKQAYEDYGSDGRTQPSLARMMDDCRTGQIDIVMVSSLSRLSRDILKTVQTIKGLKSLGIRVIAEKEGIDTDEPSTDHLLEILAQVGAEE